MNVLKEIEQDIGRWLAMAALFVLGVVAGSLITIMVISGARMLQ